MRQIKDICRRFFVLPITQLLFKLRIHPTTVTLSSLFLAVIAFLFYKKGAFLVGALFLFFCGIFDTFDGELARRTNRITILGSFLDSTIDRVNEFIIYLGLFSFYYNRINYVLYWIILAMFGSMMVSYTRARAEGLGISPQIGIFERFVRFICLIVGSVLGPSGMIYIIVVLAIGTFLTSLRRIIYVCKKSSEKTIE